MNKESSWPSLLPLRLIFSPASAISFLAFMARWGALLGGFGGDDEDGGIIGLLAMAIFAPFAAMLIRLAISRSEEFRADRSGAEISGKPLGLARALQKLQRSVKQRPMKATPGRQATAHMFIVAPLSGGGLSALFSTHPPTEKRIARLEALVSNV